MIQREEVPALEARATDRQSKAWKWWIAGVLFLATVLTYLDRQTISLCGPMLAAEFNLTNEQFGRLLAAFRWAYAMSHIPAGFLADHFPIRPIYALAVGVWSLAGAAGALVSGVRQLLFTRAVLGVGEAFNWPCATRIVANMLPPSGLAGLGITSIIANYTACQQDFSFANVGLVAGILGMSSNVFSAVVNPMIGQYVDRTSNYTLIFVLLAALPAVSLTAILIFDSLVHGHDAAGRSAGD